MADDSTSVRVAVRIRPQSAREVIDMCRTCTSVTPGEPQVILGADKAFTYDYVFDVDVGQVHIYNTCVRHLIEGCLQGYNATVLAYGQTGSGKTYTMGTGLEAEQTVSESFVSEGVGILPRSVHHLFTGIERLRQEALEAGRTPPEFRVQAQFLELYNEEIIDLLEPTTRGQKSDMKIHEDPAGGIYVAGATSRCVSSSSETLQCLHMGALARTTASTQMNAQSSRSHAIFTLHIRQQRLAPTQNGNGDGDESAQSNVGGGNGGGDVGSELETLSAKLHFVDLAGSERLKRTGATGDRAKEGISINCGLLALGNVISALGDSSRKALHVPYRDSKLTRLLQDSLGGNSRTLMIACCSPSDRDFMETLNTLKYANRARNIKNRVVLNQDRSSRTIALLRQEILQLQQELADYKQGKRLVAQDGQESVNDMFHENRLLQTENQTLRTRLKALQETVNSMTVRNTELQAQKAAAAWSKAGSDSDITQMVHNYLMEIEELRARLCESENICAQLRKSAALQHKSPAKMSTAGSPGKLNTSSSVSALIEEAKRNLEKDKTLLQKNQLRREVSGGHDSAMEGSSSSMDPHNLQVLGAETQQRSDPSSPEVSDEESHSRSNCTSSSSSSDDEDDDSPENGIYSMELAELTSEISVKQKLIEELELSQRRLDIMKHHYEEKLVQLQERIRATQEERDKVLAGFSSQNGSGSNNSNMDGQLKRVREDYERKLADMQSRLKKLQAAQQEHAKLVKSQSENERQLKAMKSDLLEMKRNKVKLMQKMKEETTRHKELELKRTREIAQLRKESRKRENEIRTLQLDKRVKETVLKRKQEEVNALRKMQRGTLSEQAAGRVIQSRVSRKPKVPFSPKVAKHKWQRLEHSLTQMALNRLTVSQLEKDLERLMSNRDELSRSLAETMRIRDRALMRNKEESYIRELDDQLESLKANIDYVQENISECQRNIVQIEETKDGQGDLDTVESLAQPADMEEARYLLAKLTGMTLNQATLAAQREAGNKELQSQVKQVLERDAVHQQLLQHVLANSDLEVYNLVAAAAGMNMSSIHENEGLLSTQSSRSASPDSMITVNSNVSGRYRNFSKKARRLTFAAPEELLYCSPNDGPTVQTLQEESETPHRSPKNEIRPRPTDTLPSALLLPPAAPGPSSGASATTSATSLVPAPSPRLPRKSANHSNSNLLAKLNSSDPNDLGSGSTPPASPPVYRRAISREENPNVFSRLTLGTNVGCEPQPDRGVVHPYQGKLSNKAPLVCSRTAEGHCQAVLSICATENNLFSASKDRTVKVWDLISGVEIQSLDRHPNNVVAVKYSAETGLVFTASSAYVKVWDLRQSPSRCIKTLSSSGWPASGNQANTTSTRSLQLPQGETLINDIALSSQSSAVLYAAAGNQVRIWDIRKFNSTGKLSGGHQAAVMCLTVGAAPKSASEITGVEHVVTGSKDHYVKVFEVRNGASGVLTPRFNLDPPHYDGVQCLSLHGSTLVSGSRDACIKVWDIEQGEQVLSLSNAHRDWICGLAHLPHGRVMISGCRGGMLHLWSTETWEAVGEMRAHASSVNAIAFNSTNIFTASNDNTVNIWRMRSSVDISPDPSEQY